MDLENFLKKNGIWHRFIEKPETIHTADAAKVSGIELQRLTKNLVARNDTGYIMIIIPGDKKVDLEKVAKLVDAKKVRLVSFEQTEEISGYPPGGTPSIGHKTKMKTVFDKSLTRYETIYCGGGSRQRILELKVSDVIKLSEAIVEDITLS
jgi:Cys-tRNA(Pro)/Cys-tRNA(Cys) deacylase